MSLFIITALIAGAAIGFVVGFSAIWMYCCNKDKDTPIA